MDLPLLEELEEEERLFKRFKFSGTDDVQVAGNLKSGFIVNVRRVSEEGAAEPEPGACCLDDGTCEVVTFGQCLLDGGVFQGGGTVCEDFDCTQGACCADDGSCSITTEEDCTGTYQGNGTVCDPNPCPTTPSTGACCHDTVCSTETQADCEGDGGIYQGDGTDCDPNPCCCGCGFDGLLTSQKYLTKTTHIVRSDGVPANPEGCVEGCSGSWDLTTINSFLPDADCNCNLVTECFGSATITDCGGTTSDCDYVPGGSAGFCDETGCTSGEGCSIGSLVCVGSCFSGCPDYTILSDTEATAHCRYDAPPPNEGAFAELSITITLSNPIC